MRAAVLLRPMQHYKRSSFAAGLTRHGFEIIDRWEPDPGPRDLIFLWNRTRGFEEIAKLYERSGARVVITENGYIEHPGKGKYYALALDRHNGAGRWFVGDRARHPISDRPWRDSGDHILVLPQRGIGSPGVAMPFGWIKGVRERLAKITDRPVVFRPHPGHGRNNLGRTLEQELAGAHCAVTWGSGAAIKAIQSGMPAFHELATWIGAPGSARLDGQIEACNMPDRELLWSRISWAQWTLEEIESGEAFDALLNAPVGDLFCAGQQPVRDRGERDVRGCAPCRVPEPSPALDRL